MSAEELLALRRWLGEHVEGLRRELEDIDAEPQSKGITARPLSILPATVRTLDYQGTQTRQAPSSFTGDSYADAARSYGLRATLILGAVVIAGIGLLCFLCLF